MSKKPIWLDFVKKKRQFWVIVIVLNQQHLKKTLAGLMNQLPCNSLYCVPGRLVKLIWFYNSVDQAQKQVMTDPTGRVSTW